MSEEQTKSEDGNTQTADSTIIDDDPSVKAEADKVEAERKEAEAKAKEEEKLKIYTDNFLKDFAEKVAHEDRFSDTSKEELLAIADNVKPGDKEACINLEKEWSTKMQADVEGADKIARAQSENKSETKPKEVPPKSHGLNLAKENANNEEAAARQGDPETCYNDSKTHTTSSNKE